MEPKLVLLGYSNSVLAMIFNALKANKAENEIIVLENMATEDSLPYDSDFQYQRKWFNEYKIENQDKLFLSAARVDVKKNIYNFFLSNNQIEKKQFINIIHPFSNIASNTELKSGIYIGPGCVIDALSKIGFGVFINRNTSIGHHTFIGDFSTINPGVHIAGNCQIGAEVSIGIGAVVFDNTSIGSGSIIGGGSVVTKDIPANVLAYGNPCKVIRELA